jgi:hypothetical protein
MNRCDLFSTTKVASVLLVTAVLAACGGSGPTPAPASSSGAGSETTTAAGGGNGGGGGGGNGGGSGTAVGYDCTTLISPAELDTVNGLKGTTIETTGRGDQPGQGEVAGVTECLIDNPSAGTWFGSFDVYTGPSLDNFGALWDLAKEGGATSLDGVGTEALYKNDESGTDIWAKGPNGINVSIALAWDTGATTESAVRDSLKQILTTVLSRT